MARFPRRHFCHALDGGPERAGPTRCTVRRAGRHGSSRGCCLDSARPRIKARASDKVINSRPSRSLIGSGSFFAQLTGTRPAKLTGHVCLRPPDCESPKRNQSAGVPELVGQDPKAFTRRHSAGVSSSGRNPDVRKSKKIKSPAN
jgi:hypothetical protein